MNIHDKKMSDLADRAARGEPGAMTEWCRIMEPQLAPIVRHALSDGTRARPDSGDLTQRILATARKLTETDPVLASRHREYLVRPVAHQIAKALVRRSRPDPVNRQGMMDTVRM
jgi:hypothetical protein